MAKTKLPTPRAKKRAKKAPSATATAALSLLAARIRAAGQEEIAAIVEELAGSKLDSKDALRLTRLLERVEDQAQVGHGPPNLTGKRLAEWLGIPPQRVSRLQQEGLPRTPDARYNVGEALRWLLGFLDKCRKLESRFRKISATADKYKTEQAERLAMENAKLRGDLVSRESIESGRIRRANMLRLELDRMARSLAPALVGKQLGDIEEALAEETRRILVRFAGNGKGD